MRAASLSLLMCLGACGFGDDGKLSRADATIDAQPIDAMIDAAPMARVFEVSPALTIPDNNSTGVTVPFEVTGVTATIGVDVFVNVTHAYRGEIRIEFLRGTTIVKTLKTSATDAADNIIETYQVTASELGLPLNASYGVKFVDTANLDTGTINMVRLTFKVR